MQPPSISLNFNLAKLLLFLISTRYVPPFAEIQGFFKIKIRRPSLRRPSLCRPSLCRPSLCRPSLFRLIHNCIESSTIAESLASHTLHPAIPLY